MGALLWCAGFILAPFLVGMNPEFAHGLYAFYGKICHQLDDRSLHVAGNPLAVCARCSSVYCGFLVGSVIVMLFRTSLPSSLRLMAITAMAPMVLDVIAGFLGISSPSMVSKILTGSWFGLLSSFFLIPMMQGAVEELRSKTRGLPDAV